MNVTDDSMMLKFRAAACRMIARNDGVSAVEYSVLLATVIASVAIGIYCLGELSTSSFDKVTHVMETTDQVSGDVVAADSVMVAQPAVSQTLIYVLAAAFVVGCGAPVGYILFRLRKQNREMEEEEEQPEEAPAAPPTETDLAFEKRQRIRRVFEENMSSLLNGELRARHIMSRQVTCVRTSTPTGDVVALFEAKGIGHILVRDKNDRLVGIISKKDSTERSGKTAADLMSPDPFTLDAESKISVGITQIICRRVTCLPVLGKNKALTGVITTTDFLLAFQCAIQTLDGVVNHIGITEQPSVQPTAAPNPANSTDDVAVPLTSA
ncbi:HPP family protein [Planctomycetota bacterium]